MTALRDDRWVAVGLKDAVAPESSNPVIVDGYEIAVWRGRGEDVRVWEDRCPHRGMRLSFGFVRDETLTCLYHGWRYDVQGRCRMIPAHPALTPPRTICARSFETRTTRGIVYANLADAPEATWSEATEEGWHAVRSIYPRVAMDSVRSRLVGGETVFGGPLVEAAHLRFDAHTAQAGRVSLALQPVGESVTAVHVACESADPEARLALARRVVRLRRELERH